MLQIALVGLTASGKTALFNALTGAHEQVGTYAGLSGATHAATVPVPDKRLDNLVRILVPTKVVPVMMEFIDTPGLAVGANESRKGNARLLGTLREVDALGLVVRAFASDTVAHPRETLNPARDVADIEAELVVADFEIVEKRSDRIVQSLKKNLPTAERKLLDSELVVVNRALQALNEGHGADTCKFTPEERKLISSLALLTLLPRIVIVNLDESTLGSDSWKAGLESRPWLVGIAAKWEMELNELSAEERAEFMKDAGVAELALPRVVSTCYHALDMVTFYTGHGHTESRAWELPRGSDIVVAAGHIHTDIARGFIRAEITPYDSIAHLGSLKEVRAAGQAHLEGRTYIVRDGDLLDIRFSPPA
jgi:ribosome-binding ATPase